MKRILLVGGGTAGHVEPALAVGNWLRQHDATLEIRFMGTAQGIESRLVPQSGFPLIAIEKAALPRKLNFQALTWPFRFSASLMAALRAVRAADIVIGFGGYVCAPAYLAARILGVPTIIHEANALPGFANRLGARWAAVLDIAFESAKKIGGPWSQAQNVGMPIRSEITDITGTSQEVRSEIRKRLANEWQIDLSRPVIFIFGGSLGARTLNLAVAEFLESPEARPFTIIHSVGKSAELPVSTSTYKALPYVENMAEVYAIADLVIARSGAVTCAELETMGVPAILVPLPIGNGEQEANAQGLVSAGQATIVSNEEFTGSWLTSHILTTMDYAKQAGSRHPSNRHTSAASSMGEQALAILSKAGEI